MRIITLALVAITMAALCAALAPALASAQTPQPTPPGPLPGECGELAPGPSPAFATPTDLAVRWGPLPDNPQFSGALLSWRDNADNETCYVAERKGPGTTDWEEILIAPSANWENMDDRNFEAPGYYCYRVFAGSEAGRSSYSNEACLEVPEATVHGLPLGAPPPGPATLPPIASATAFPGTQTPQPTPPGPYEQGQCGELAPEPSPSFATPTDLAVSWGPLPDNPQFSGALLSWRDNADNETCYVVERKGPGTTDWGQVIIAPSANWEHTEDMNFVEPGYFCYRVFAGNPEGRSAYSNEACLQVPQATVATSPPPGAPAAAFPNLGGGPPGADAPFYLWTASLLAAGAVLACGVLVVLAARRR